MIGRWNSTDPYGQCWSSYLGMGNDPVNSTDPDGGYSKFWAGVRNFFSGGSGVYQSGFTEDGKRGVYGYNKDGVAHFGNDARSFNFSATDELLGLASHHIPDPTAFETGNAIEPSYPETWLMPVPKGIQGLGYTAKATRSIAVASALKKTLPSAKKIVINIKHIIDNHTSTGKGYSQSKGAGGTKDMWAEGLNSKQIESITRSAYEKVHTKLSTQGDRVRVRGTSSNGTTVEMWVNTATKTIETAYPKY